MNGLRSVVPSGKNGPLAARIMAVADVYEAMRSPRVYKGAESHEVAVRTIVDGSGTHFDPAVVRALIQSSSEFERIWEDPSR